MIPISARSCLQDEASLLAQSTLHKVMELMGFFADSANIKCVPALR